MVNLTSYLNVRLIPSAYSGKPYVVLKRIGTGIRNAIFTISASHNLHGFKWIPEELNRNPQKATANVF